MASEREQLAAKIRALRAKTVANGCTEDEAIAAAAKVAELLARYNMTVDEAELRASPFERHTEAHEDLVGERLWKTAAAIAELTSARYWVSRPGVSPVEINFFGFAHEVDVARYLLEICAGAMRREQRRLQQETRLFRAAIQRRRILPFLDGMADRLHRRILALKPPRPTGSGLVAAHDSLIEAAMPVSLGARATRSSRDFEDSYRDGLRAADGVALNRGLTSGARASGLLN